MSTIYYTADDIKKLREKPRAELKINEGVFLNYLDIKKLMQRIGILEAALKKRG